MSFADRLHEAMESHRQQQSTQSWCVLRDMLLLRAEHIEALVRLLDERPNCEAVFTEPLRYTAWCNRLVDTLTALEEE